LEGKKVVDRKSDWGTEKSLRYATTGELEILGSEWGEIRVHCWGWGKKEKDEAQVYRNASGEIWP